MMMHLIAGAFPVLKFFRTHSESKENSEIHLTTFETLTHYTKSLLIMFPTVIPSQPPSVLTQMEMAHWKSSTARSANLKTCASTYASRSVSYLRSGNTNWSTEQLKMADSTRIYFELSVDD